MHLVSRAAVLVVPRTPVGGVLSCPRVLLSRPISGAARGRKVPLGAPVGPRRGVPARSFFSNFKERLLAYVPEGGGTRPLNTWWKQALVVCTTCVIYVVVRADDMYLPEGYENRRMRAERAEAMHQAVKQQTRIFAIHNLSPAWPNDTVMFGVVRPGGQIPTATTEKRSVALMEVRAWEKVVVSAFGASHVISLLGDDEVEMYGFDIDQHMKKNARVNYNRISLFKPGARDKLFALFDALKAQVEDGWTDSQNPRCVVHCSAGEGRAGLVLALWLVRAHGLSPEQACKEVVETAKQLECRRRPDVDKLHALLEDGQLPRPKPQYAPPPKA